LSTLNGLKIPDIEDKKGNYLKDNTFSIEGRPDKVDFTTDVPQNPWYSLAKRSLPSSEQAISGIN